MKNSEKKPHAIKAWGPKWYWKIRQMMSGDTFELRTPNANLFEIAQTLRGYSQTYLKIAQTIRQTSQTW